MSTWPAPGAGVLIVCVLTHEKGARHVRMPDLYAAVIVLGIGAATAGGERADAQISSKE